MNCANHPDIPRTAFCRTCGKALCASCTRNVRGVIYCEDCLAARLNAGVSPAANVAQATQDQVYPPVEQPLGARVPPVSGPNPALAGILSIFPGVGAVYNGQYAKGLAHMGIFVMLILGTIHVSGLIFGLALGFFCVYQVIDAVRSAHAIQRGLPAPDPFGLGQTFGTGEKVDTSKIPVGAVVLIGLGALFLLKTLDVPYFDMDRIWPVILIAVGVWLFAKRQGAVGWRRDGYIRPLGLRGLSGPVVLVTLGILFLIHSFDGPDFGRTWPVLLLAIGLSKLLESKAPPVPLVPPPVPGMVPPVPPGPEAAGVAPENIQPPSSEVNNG
jgi:TM2 domain-containing membrane protein YozV